MYHAAIDCWGVTLAVAKDSEETLRSVRTIDQVIGRNLRALRRSEALTLAEAAEVVAVLTHKPLSESSLSRWETGYNHFTVTDLYEWSQVYGVNLIALLQPQDDVTHVHVSDRDVPVDSYAVDFFIDPRGTFTDRARNFAERNAEGTRDVVDALNDITDRLGKKGRLADLHASYAAFKRLSDIGAALYHEKNTNPTRENQNRFDDFILAFDGWGRKLDPRDLERRLKRAGYPLPLERRNDGINQEDE
jgi:transcriptional regulator with XRE-family HTH domain